jgi:hypothetical protein
MWSKLGIGSLCLAIIALGYPIIVGIIGLGYTDKVDFSPQSLLEILGRDSFLWVENIPVGVIQSAVNYLVNLPLFLLLFGISIIFILIHFISPEKD